MRCLTGQKFTMNAEVLHQSPNIDGGVIAPTEPVGSWSVYQDPITGEILNDWIPGVPDNPSTPQNEELVPHTIECLARGIISSGVGNAGSTEIFGEVYQNVDVVRLWVPTKYNLTKGDRITNIRDKKGGKVLWKEEDGTATVFNIDGVTPVLDPFNRHIENFMIIRRA